MPRVEWGPYIFASGTFGYAPQGITGPKKDIFVVEHSVPGRETGVVDYMGSRDPGYAFKGFLSPPMDGPGNAAAGRVLSGTSYIGITSDDAKDFLFRVRGSGPNLLRIESPHAVVSGFAILYENDFFYNSKTSIAYEPGRTYPYYPYAIDFVHATMAFFGQNSGVTTFSGDSVGYFSGFARYSLLESGAWGTPLGRPLIALSLYVKTVASGNARMALYEIGQTLAAQSASQAVHSGWNYFPLRPSFTPSSGSSYYIAFAGDAVNASGFTVLYVDYLSGGQSSFIQSGLIYSSGFPSSVTLAWKSGYFYNVQLVTI